MKSTLLGAVLASLVGVMPVFAQQTTGTIAGRVIDQQGAAAPGATVTARSSQTGFARTEPSDSEGIYRLTALPVGAYDVTVVLSGFSTASRQNVEVSVADTHTLDIVLRVAAVAETVNVVA